MNEYNVTCILGTDDFFFNEEELNLWEYPVRDNFVGHSLYASTESEAIGKAIFIIANKEINKFFDVKKVIVKSSSIFITFNDGSTCYYTSFKAVKIQR